MVYGIYNELVTGAFVNQLTYLRGLTLQAAGCLIFVVEWTMAYGIPCGYD